MSETEVGKVYLVGAGPGDPELITVRGLRCLRQADLVLYDALVHADILKECRPDAECIFVGKRAGRRSERQSDINQRLIEAARAGKKAVRLKGGDPYLFGRGSEEAEILANAKIPFEVIPGVPSPLAATAYAGISLTHRELASSVAYITATESVAKDRSSHDWAKLATATQTLVIFMGMRKLDTLMQLLIEHGRAPETPAAVVQWASLPKQKTVIGSVADIAERARDADLSMPALTIVGDVVSLRQTLRWYDNQPLFGKKILVPRARHQSSELESMLRDRGAQALSIPLLEIVPAEDPAPLKRAIDEINSYAWIILTSHNAVASLFQKLHAAGKDARHLGATKIAAIGGKTARALGMMGVEADLVPKVSHGEGLAQALLEQGGVKAGTRVLLPRAERAREVLVNALREAGVVLDVVTAYRTLPPKEDALRELKASVSAGDLNAVLLTSGSTVEHLCAGLGENAAEQLSSSVLASIGPVTTQAAQAQGLSITVESETPTMAALVEALEAHYLKQH